LNAECLCECLRIGTNREKRNESVNTPKDNVFLSPVNSAANLGKEALFVAVPDRRFHVQMGSRVSSELEKRYQNQHYINNTITLEV
jgi:hypothetical protein